MILELAINNPRHAYIAFLATARYHFYMLTVLLPAYIVFLLALASPGPDFVMIVRNSIKAGYRAGIFTALGISLAMTVHFTYVNIGLGAIIAHSIVAFTIIKYCAAAYLIYIGYKALRSQPYAITKDSDVQDVMSDRAAFTQGFIANVLNPKAAIFFLSLFTMVLNPDLSAVVIIGFSMALMVTAFLWFTAVSYFLSRQRVRHAFTRIGHWFDRTMGCVLIALGIKVALTTK